MPRDVEFREMGFVCALDNHEPTPRKYGYGNAYEYNTEHVTNGIEIRGEHARQFGKPRNIAFLIDDGNACLPYYVAGWGPEENYKLILHPFPVNPDGKRRVDNGHVIDYSTWMVGPQKTYHLKVNRKGE